MVHRTSTKLPIPWSSKVPKRYKRNAIIGDLHRSKRISMNFADEVKHIKSKFLRADYPLRFVDSIIRNFLSENDVEESFIIPPNLFDEDKLFLLIDIPFCEKNENKSKDFIKKFHHFTNGKYRISIKWITKKVKSLFPLKDKNIYPACKIYHGLCSCQENYIDESKRNMATRWGEHNNPTHDSQPAKHLSKNIHHSYNWSILANASKYTRTRKNLEALYIALLRPSLNDQLKSNKLLLFRNGIT